MEENRSHVDKNWLDKLLLGEGYGLVRTDGVSGFRIKQ
jgi:hypothetical protein